MRYTNLISWRSWRAIPQGLPHIIGIKAAYLLSELCAEYEYRLTRDELGEDQSFFATIEAIEQATALTVKEQRTAINTLTEHGVITVKAQGVPPVRRFTINQSALRELLEKAENSICQKGTNPICPKGATNDIDLADNTSSSFTSSSTYIYVDDRWTKIHDTYFSYFHTEPMGMDSQRLRQYLDEVGMDAVLYAMEEAHKRDVHVPGAYIRRICESLVLRGISDDESFKRFKDSLPQSQARVTADKVDWDALIAKARKEQGTHDS